MHSEDKGYDQAEVDDGGYESKEIGINNRRRPDLEGTAIPAMRVQSPIPSNPTRAFY